MSHVDSSPPDHSPEHVPSSAGTRDGAGDFDFLVGRWRVINRRRPRSPVTSTEWEEFEARSVVRALWSGGGNLEEWEADTAAGTLRAVSLHLYDAGACQWRLHWATERDGRVGVPTVGAFSNGLGEFFAQEDIEGRSTLLRITWEDRGSHACRWEQSFSADGGRSWQSDWTMEFIRDE
jgi:hypothetical protein